MAQKEKMLKEEVEEMKATLSCTEEGRARASAHSKHVVSQKAQQPLLNSAFILSALSCVCERLISAASLLFVFFLSFFFSNHSRRERTRL